MSVTVSPRGLLAASSLATLLLGLVAAVVTLGPWFEIGFGPVTGRINGWNSQSTSGDFGPGSDDDLSAFSIEEPTTSDSEDVDWILGSLPDGVPVAVMGVLVAAIGLMLFLRARNPGALATAARRREVAQLAGAAAVIAAATAVWTIFSWRRFKADVDDQITESLGEDDFGFGAFFLASFDVEPGWGLLTSGITLGLAAVVCALAALLALQAAPAVAAVAGAPSGGMVPPAAGPSAGGQPPGGATWAPGPATPSVPPPAPHPWGGDGPGSGPPSPGPRAD